MIYLDYSATTPTSKEVLDTFNKVSLDYIGNPNSSHKLGVEANLLIESATSQIADFIGCQKEEVIYTSGASEANNLAIKGVCLKYSNRGKHIITTELEHSSIYGPISYLVDNYGFEVDFVKLDQNGLVDLNNLKSLLRDDTILVSIASVNSEVGLLQPIAEISKLVKERNFKTFFHSDMTQSIGRLVIDIKNVDFLSFSAHKFFGLKGIGCLIKKANIQIEPLINGGKSTTIYRSGTPATALIASLAKALRLSYENNKSMDHIIKFRNEIINNLDDEIIINSNDYCVPYILNISVLGIKPETFQHSLAEHDIYVSTQSACHAGDNPSKAVLAISNDLKKASSSIRISLAYLTTEEEIKTFIKICNKCYNNLKR